MRGFRGSRSAQNEFNSRFGKDQHEQVQDKNRSGSPSNLYHLDRRVLPDWLKTPETKAREEEEAKLRPAPPLETRPLPQVAEKPVQIQTPKKREVAPVTETPSRKKIAPARSERKPVAAKAKSARKTAAKGKTAAKKTKARSKAA